MAEVGIAIPEWVSLVAVDFTRESLPEVLARTAFDSCAPTFFTWLGVTYYLSRKVVTETFRHLAAVSPAGSRLVFDCMDAEAFQPERASVAVRRLQEIARRTGEPMESGFGIDELAAVLAEAGFRIREHLAPRDIEARLFQGRDDGYHAFDHIHLIQAERA
jgi:methyltransferase (TIGR00027 family)